MTALAQLHIGGNILSQHRGFPVSYPGLNIQTVQYGVVWFDSWELALEKVWLFGQVSALPKKRVLYLPIPGHLSRQRAIRYLKHMPHRRTQFKQTPQRQSLGPRLLTFSHRQDLTSQKNPVRAL